MKVNVQIIVFHISFIRFRYNKLECIKLNILCHQKESSIISFARRILVRKKKVLMAIALPFSCNSSAIQHEFFPLGFIYS